MTESLPLQPQRNTKYKVWSKTYANADYHKQFKHELFYFNS